MATALDRLWDKYHRGSIDRRELMKGIAALTGGALASKIGGASAAAAPGIAPAMSINHVNIGVKDVKRTADFYAAVFGARPQASGGPMSQTMSFPAAKPGFGSWVSIGSTGGVSRAGIDGWDGTPGVITHVGYGVTIPNTDFPKIAEQVTKRFPTHKMPSLFKTEAAGQECMMFDPDGIAYQLIPIDHNGTLAGYSKETGLKLTGAQGPQDMAAKAPVVANALAPATSLSHVHLDVHDIKRTMEYYSVVFGAVPKQTTGPKNQTMYFPGAKAGYGSWLSLSQVDANTKPGYNHVGYGTPVPQEKYKMVEEELKKRWPDIKPPHWFITEAAGIELYFFDPDGISVQIIQMDHNGELTGYDAKTGAKLKG